MLVRVSGLTTRCSRRRASGAGWCERGHVPAAAERERYAEEAKPMTFTAKVRRHVVGLAAVGILAAGGTLVRGESVSLSTMTEKDSVTVIVWLWGCFGYESKYKLTIRPHPDIAGSAVVDIVNANGIWHRRVGTRVLSSAELQALDAGLNVYRKPHGGCVSTQITRLRLRLRRDGDLMGEEMHYGNACSVERVPGALDFESVIFPSGSTGAVADPAARHNKRMQRTHSRVTSRAEKAHGPRRAARR